MCGSVGFMVDGRVVFGVVVSQIAAAFVPVEAILCLGFTASEPGATISGDTWTWFSVEQWCGW
jgi:hypothetical protein